MPLIGDVYIARYGRFHRVFSLCSVGLLLAWLPSTGELWRMGGWLFAAGLAALYAAVIYSVLETWVRSTVFAQDGIRHRSFLGLSKSFPYSSVREGIIRKRNSLTFEFDGGGRVKVWAKEGHPEQILEFVEPFLRPDVKITGR